MAYKLPSTHIYQLLENSGGAANVTPDLSAVIVGPLFNLVDIDIDKAKARSSDFSVWPRMVVKPEPEPEPEPEPDNSFLTVNPIHYVDFGYNGYGFTITGTSSDDIDTNLALDLYVTDMNGVETLVQDSLTTLGELTRDPVTKAWRYTSTTTDLSILNIFGTYDATYTFKVVCSSGDLEKSASVTRVLSTLTIIAEPELDLTLPVTMSIDEPTWFYHYENVTVGAEIS